MKEAVRSTYLVRFEGFEVNLRTGELWKNNERIRLPEQSFQILAMLFERPGEVVTRQEIQQRLWPNDTVVEFETSINAAMRRLRACLGDSADQPRFIETLARRGYRWKLQVEWIESPKAPTPPHPVSLIAPFVSHLIGKRVSHYRVLEILGGGGMGVVYKAEDIKLGRRVALKFLPEELADDAKAMERLQREARAASTLNHPNICTIYEVEEHEGQPFIVMELLEGQTLREFNTAGSTSDQATNERKGLPLETLFNLASQIAEGLEAAHKHGIIHRDIKPTNIFVTANGRVKILDFGVAKLQEPETVIVRSAGAASDTAPSGVDPNLTITGMAIGTAGYMSPEQVRGEDLDARTDLFSFGLVLYEMAAEQRAFMGENVSMVHRAILQDRPIPVRERNPDIPIGVENIINKALEKDREWRYQSAAAMRADMQLAAENFRSTGGSTNVITASEPRNSVPWLSVLRKHLWIRILLAAALSILALGLILNSRQHRAPALSETDTVLVADFVNNTGEPIFDGTLRQAVTAKLAESPYLNLVPLARTRKVLSSLGHSPDERVVPPLAREVCQRAGARVVVGGSIRNAGDLYVLDLDATDCGSGARVGHEATESPDKNQVLGELGKALSGLRQRLGESASSIQRFDTPITQATTKSLAALKAFASGEEKRAQGKVGESVPDYKLAVELDPDFATAYARLAAVTRSLNQNDLADEYLRKAFERREHVSDKEKFYIQARYYSDTAREPENEIETYKLWAEVYPRDYVAYNGLTSAYIEIGQLEKAVETGQQGLRLNADHALSYANIARAYERAGRLPEAKAICERASSEKVDSFWTHMILYRIAFVESDGPAMQREGDWFKDKPQESVSNYDQAKAAMSGGEARKSRVLFRQARLLAEKRGLKEQVAAIANGEAQFSAEMGNRPEALAMAELALRTAPNSSRHQAYVALGLARSGDIHQAEALMRAISQRPGLGTAMQNVVLPLIDAAIALDKKNPGAVIDILEPATRYDLGQDSGGATYYYRGLAYLQLKKPAEAASQFQQIVDHRGLVMVDVYWPLAHLGLARAYAMLGDKDKSLAYYREVLTCWKNADSDLDIYRQAKKEYQKLMGKA